MVLENIGWNGSFAREFAKFEGGGVVPARVCFASRGHYRLLAENGELVGLVSGKRRQGGLMPVVGDWVAAELLDFETALIKEVLPRQSQILKSDAAERKSFSDAPVSVNPVVSNVDLCLIVCGLDRDFNLRRLERYVALVYGGGVQPAILLNKADLCPDPESMVAQASSVAAGVFVAAISARESSGVALVRDLIGSGKTVCMLGSSGAGKSTLLNSLMGSQLRATSSTSDHSGKGRHTTTSRELFPIPGGNVLIDTPGLREVAVSSFTGIELAFPEISAFAENCRFRDCSHTSEPGCGVLAAVGEGLLDWERLESYHKLQKDAVRRQKAADGTLAAEERAKWRSIHKSMRHLKK